MSRTTLALTLAVAIGSLVLGGCGESGPPPDCLDVPRDLLTDIREGLTVAGGGRFRAARAYRSGAHRNAHFVAAEIDGPGLEDLGNIGLWFVDGSLDKPGQIFAVPHVATQFSEFRSARETAFRATRDDPGAKEARQCLRYALRSP